MVDYKKFDSIIDSDEEDDVVLSPSLARQQLQPPSSSSSSSLSPSPLSSLPPGSQPVTKMTKKGKEGRLKYEYEGRTIYEWEQNLNEVLIYINPPPGITKKELEIDISHRHLKIGIKNTAPYIDEDTWGPVKTSESMWMMDDGELIINLQKMNKAETWECALLGRHGQTVDPVTKEEIRKKMMLERFQEEV
jgi:hypothetical protein